MEHVATYLPGILLAYGVVLVGLSSPGPNILAVMGTSMNDGRGAGLSLGLGVALGTLCWAVLTIAGLTAVLAAYSGAFIAIKIAGGCYLLWLAYKAFRAAAADQDLAAKVLPGSRRTKIDFFLRGLTVQMTNPKALLAWIATISIGLQPGAPLWVGVSIAIGAFILSLIAHTLYALVFSTPVMVSLYAKARRGIQFTFGALFTFAGVRLLLSRP